jgi:hypothetical protein
MVGVGKKENREEHLDISRKNGEQGGLCDIRKKGTRPR